MSETHKTESIAVDLNDSDFLRVHKECFEALDTWLRQLRGLAGLLSTEGALDDARLVEIAAAFELIAVTVDKAQDTIDKARNYRLKEKRWPWPAGV